MFGRGSVSAQPELGIEGAEEDVSDVERPKWTLFENGLELVAVAGPPTGWITTDQERSHGWVSPSCRRPWRAKSDRPRSCSARLDAPIAVRRYGQRRATGVNASSRPRSS